jgi:hypothetical protein
MISIHSRPLFSEKFAVVTLIHEDESWFSCIQKVAQMVLRVGVAASPSTLVQKGSSRSTSSSTSAWYGPT